MKIFTENDQGQFIPYEPSIDKAYILVAGSFIHEDGASYTGINFFGEASYDDIEWFVDANPDHIYFYANIHSL